MKAVELEVVRDRIAQQQSSVRHYRYSSSQSQTQYLSVPKHGLLPTVIVPKHDLFPELPNCGGRCHKRMATCSFHLQVL
jgi:hypothetical protein